METIKYEITEKDIKNYLIKHSNDELIKFKEALFVKYIKDQGLFSIEKIEMLLNKSKTLYNYVDIKGIYGFGEHYGVLDYPVDRFENYLKTQTIDTSIYLHVLIPILGLHKDKLFKMELTKENIDEFLPSEFKEYDESILSNTIENYQITGKIKDKKDVCVNDILLTNYECLNILEQYSKIYGITVENKIYEKRSKKINILKNNNK